MKKVIIKLICFAVLAAVALSLAGCILESEPEYDEYGISYNKDNEVINIRVDASGADATVTIPDQHDGKNVAHISTKSGRIKFNIIGESVIIDYQSKVIDTQPFYVYINIGKNIDYVFVGVASHFYKRTDENEYIEYYVKAFINCSEENETFISEDGYLYYRNAYNRGERNPIN